ncbi:MAG: hypothetical protein HKN47_27695 [Pirellulaceae bacterium]|nr:hypothetical protein [Pirellulaceae bacterium]
MSSDDTNEHPEDEAIAQLAADLSGESNDDPATDANDDPSTSPNAWGWLFVGLVAAILSFVVAKVVISELQTPLSEEYTRMVDATPNAEGTPETDAMMVANIRTNHGRLLYSLGAVMALIFGWSAGFIHQRLPKGILGALAGIIVAIPLGMLTAAPILNLQATAVSSFGSSDLYGILLHTIQWIVIGLPIVIAVGIGTGRTGNALKVAGGVVLSALLASVVYVIGGTLLDPSVSLAYAEPKPGNVFYLWTCVSPLLLGLFMWRSKS